MIPAGDQASARQHHTGPDAERDAPVGTCGFGTPFRCAAGRAVSATGTPGRLARGHWSARGVPTATRATDRHDDMLPPVRPGRSFASSGFSGTAPTLYSLADHPCADSAEKLIVSSGLSGSTIESRRHAACETASAIYNSVVADLARLTPTRRTLQAFGACGGCGVIASTV